MATCTCSNQLQPHDEMEACRVRKVVGQYDGFTQPSGDALLRDLHRVLDGQGDGEHPYAEELHLGGEG